MQQSSSLAIVHTLRSSEPALCSHRSLPTDTFPALSGTSNWQAVRTTVNKDSNAGLTDVSSDQIRCYTTSSSKAPSIQTVAAGSSVGFTASPNIFHPGPLQFYLAKVPSGQTAATWDGTGDVWFKIYAEKATVSGGQLSWGSLSTLIPSLSLSIPYTSPSESSHEAYSNPPPLQQTKPPSA